MLSGRENMAHNFDNNLSFGTSIQQPTGFRALRHPFVVLAHVGFRGAAIFVYVFANLFFSSFIQQFLIIVRFFISVIFTSNEYFSYFYCQQISGQ